MGSGKGFPVKIAENSCIACEVEMQFIGVECVVTKAFFSVRVANFTVFSVPQKWVANRCQVGSYLMCSAC